VQLATTCSGSDHKIVKYGRQFSHIENDNIAPIILRSNLSRCQCQLEASGWDCL
jgi:hypothetical protein